MKPRPGSFSEARPCIIFRLTILLIVFCLLIGQVTVVTALYFVCTMILSQPFGKGNGSFLVLVDLSAAYNTIDHDNLLFTYSRNMSELAVVHYG